MDVEICEAVHYFNPAVQGNTFASAGIPIDRVGAGIDKNAVRLGSVEKRAEQND